MPRSMLGCSAMIYLFLLVNVSVTTIIIIYYNIMSLNMCWMTKMQKTTTVIEESLIQQARV